MKHLVICFLTSFIYLLGYSQTGEKNFIDQNYIEVTGTAEKEITPDLIYLTIIINEKNITNKETIESVEKRMLEKLNSIGIDITKDLVLQDFSSNFKSYILKKDELISNKEYQLLVHDAKTVGVVFKELDKIGISNISISKVDHSKIEQYKKEIKIQAIKAGKEKAEALAAAVGQTTGKAIYILENNPYIYNYQRNDNQVKMLSKLSFSVNSNQNDETPFEFEKIKLEYSVLVRFELK